MIKIVGTLFFFMNLGLCFNTTESYGDLNGKALCCYFCEAERELYDLMMDYRASHGLEPIPVSNELVKVSHLHAWDLSRNFDSIDNKCNTHSWSESNMWEGCCYSSNHSNAKCMWDKPRELTNYEGNGYEIVVRATSSETDFEVNPKAVLESWKKSSGHNNVILNKDIWKEMHWSAIGVAIEGTYACVWFGEEKDQFGPPAICNHEHH